MASEQSRAKSYGKMMGFALMCGAANADADALGVRDALRAQMQEPLERFRINGQAKPVVLAIHAILGPDWVPTGEWARKIADALAPAS